MSGGEEVISLLYDDYEDCLIDPDGRPFLDTLNIISPGRFRYMKRVRGVEYVKGVKAGIVYELIFEELDGFEERRRTLYYDIKKNLFFDDDSFEVWNLFSIVSPNMVYLFKHKKEDMLVYGVTGELVELIWPEEGDAYFDCFGENMN
jgi:hypothetical protein